MLRQSISFAAFCLHIIVVINSHIPARRLTARKERGKAVLQPEFVGNCVFSSEVVCLLLRVEDAHYPLVVSVHKCYRELVLQFVISFRFYFFAPL